MTCEFKKESGEIITDEVSETNPLGFSPCYSCGKEYSEADDWAIFNNFNSPEDSAVLICPDCLKKTNMVWKYDEAYQDLLDKINRIAEIIRLK